MGMRQRHGRFKVVGIKVDTNVMVFIVVNFIVAVIYLLAWTISHFSYLLHIFTQGAYQFT